MDHDNFTKNNGVPEIISFSILDKFSRENTGKGDAF
jgi:hypothetical protein